MFTTLGLSALESLFKEASMIYTRTNGYFGESNKVIAMQAMAFIQSTGLEIMIRAYNLSYDADHLRNTFFRTFHAKPKS